MSYLLEILGRGLLAELPAAFRQLLADETGLATGELLDACRDDPVNPSSHTRLAARYLADGDLIIVDVSDPTSPFVAGYFLTFDDAWDLVVSGPYALVAYQHV